MAAANSLGLFETVGRALDVDVVGALTTVAQFQLVVALAGVGLPTSAAGLRRTGWRPFAVGLVAATVMSALSFALIGWRGPAGS